MRGLPGFEVVCEERLCRHNDKAKGCKVFTLDKPIRIVRGGKCKDFEEIKPKVDGDKQERRRG